MAKRKKKWRYIVAAVVGLIVLGWFSNRSAPLIEVTLEKAAARDITSLVTATGTVQPEIEVKISSEVAGEIVNLPSRRATR
jgi:HlyD family secretion protein